MLYEKSSQRGVLGFLSSTLHLTMCAPLDGTTAHYKANSSTNLPLQKKVSVPSSPSPSP